MSNNKADRIKRMKSLPVDKAPSHRLPPGQVLTDRFPILHEGEVPTYDMSMWSLRIFGDVEEEKTITYQQLLKLPQTKVGCDIHCVTRWSKFDNVWEGVLFRDLMKHLQVSTEAKYAMIHADYNYETNLQMDDLMGEHVLLAHSWGENPLTEKHGWPLRLVVPHLYFWKSAKWIRGIEFMTEDRPGFWESNGFHTAADPFKEQRFSGEDLQIVEDVWHDKESD